jgi:hypothetical protein
MSASAGSAKEISSTTRQREADHERGDRDGGLTMFADNAAFTSSFQPLRIEANAAIRDYFTSLFQTSPTRPLPFGKLRCEFYASDTVTVSNA